MMPPFERMWSSVTEDWVDRLISDGGKGLLGKAVYCHECGGTGYTRKSQSVWQACPIATQDAAGLLHQPQRTRRMLKLQPQDGPPKS